MIIQPKQHPKLYKYLKANKLPVRQFELDEAVFKQMLAQAIKQHPEEDTDTHFAHAGLRYVHIYKPHWNLKAALELATLLLAVLIFFAWYFLHA